MTSQTKKLLIVDDEEEIRGFLKEFFENRDYSVSTAQSPEEARKALEEEKPHVALLDIRMKTPKDGLDVLKWARSKGLKVKIIMVSAVEDEDVIREAMKLGADDYLTKPLRLESLEGSVSDKINALIQESLEEGKS